MKNYSMNGTEDKHNVSDGLKGNEDRFVRKMIAFLIGHQHTPIMLDDKISA